MFDFLDTYGFFAIREVWGGRCSIQGRDVLAEAPEARAFPRPSCNAST